MQHRMLSSPIMALPRPKGRYTLDTEPCNRQFGWVLLHQQSEGQAKTVWNWSHSLQNARMAYYTVHRYCIAVVLAFLLLRPYFQGLQSAIQTDHDMLQCILNMTGAIRKLMRWHLRLSEFDFRVGHQAAVNHKAAEALS